MTATSISPAGECVKRARGMMRCSVRPRCAVRRAVKRSGDHGPQTPPRLNDGLIDESNRTRCDRPILARGATPTCLVFWFSSEAKTLG
eukprot:30952-Pelagococcus_subviridis.AAC.4